PLRARPILLLLAGLLAGGFVPGCKRAPPPEEEKESPAPVKVVAAQRVSLGERTELLGATQPLPGHVARVAAAVEGRVQKVLGDDPARPLVEGQRVNQEQVVDQLDDRIARANRDKTQAL